MISIDGTTGIVVLGAVELVMPELTGDLDTILEWADEVRTLGVRANADNPEDAQLSRDFGAEGIGLCRTEHMFLGDRKQIIQTFILNDDELDPREGRRRPVRGPGGRLLRHVQGHGRPAGDRAPARPAAARVLGEPARAGCRDRQDGGDRRRRRRHRREARPAREDRRLRGAEPDARHARLPSGHRVPRSSPRCRCAPSPRPALDLQKEGFSTRSPRS